MHPFTQSPERSMAPLSRAWLCFCLALFLLYNPFMAATSSQSGLNVRHPASNRATVGASELEHFSPADGRDELSTHGACAVVPVAPLPEACSQVFEFFPQVVSPPQQFFGSGLWFRPPPAQ